MKGQVPLLAVISIYRAIPFRYHALDRKLLLSTENGRQASCMRTDRKGPPIPHTSPEEAPHHYSITTSSLRGTPHCRDGGSYPNNKHMFWECFRAQRSRTTEIPYVWKNRIAPQGSCEAHPGNPETFELPKFPSQHYG